MRRNPTVIVYHAIGRCPGESDPENLFVSPEAFAAQMEFLARRRNVVPLEAVVSGTAPAGRQAVAITFDDGFRSVLTEAAPVLRRHGFVATVFVPTAWLGQRSGWYEAPGCDDLLMDEDELREVERLGVAVESHGHAHLDLEATEVGRVTADLESSIEELSRILGRRPRYLAYPWGRSSEAARAAAETLGLEAAFSIDVVGGGPFALPRVGITALDGRAVFSLKSSGRYLRWRRSPFYRLYRASRPLLARRRRR